MPEEPFALTLLAPLNAAEDYDAIQAAVLGSERGRWFLQEYTRRNRSSDTALVLAAIARIEAVLRIGAFAPARENGPDVRLFELRDAIALTRENLAAIRPDGRISLKAADFDRLTSAVATVTTRVRAAAEHVQETAWALRDRGGHDRECETLEAQMREMARACALLDDIGNGATMITALLREVEERIESMIADTAREPAAAPAEEPAVPEPAPAAAAPAQTARAPEPDVAQAPEAEPAVTAAAMPQVTTPQVTSPQEASPQAAFAPSDSARTETSPAAAVAAVAATVVTATLASAAADAAPAEPPAPLPVIDSEFERMMTQAIENALASELASLPAETPPAAMESVITAEADTPAAAAEVSETPDDTPLVLDNPAAREPNISEEVYAVLTGAALPASERTPPAPAETTSDAESVPRRLMPSWFDQLAPIVRARNAPDVPAPSKIDFTLSGDSVVVASAAAAHAVAAGTAAAPQAAPAQPAQPEPQETGRQESAPAPAAFVSEPIVEAFESGDASADIFADEPASPPALPAESMADAEPLPPALAGLDSADAADAAAPASIAATLKHEIAAVMADISEAIRNELGKAMGADILRKNVGAGTNGTAPPAGDEMPAAAAVEPQPALLAGDGDRDEPPAIAATMPADKPAPAGPAQAVAEVDADARPRNAQLPLRETAPRDPLAAIVALSDEEKIALFS